MNCYPRRFSFRIEKPVFAVAVIKSHTLSCVTSRRWVTILWALSSMVGTFFGEHDQHSDRANRMKFSFGVEVRKSSWLSNFWRAGYTERRKTRICNALVSLFTIASEVLPNQLDLIHDVVMFQGALKGSWAHILMQQHRSSMAICTN